MIFLSKFPKVKESKHIEPFMSIAKKYWLIITATQRVDILSFLDRAD